MTPDGQVSVGRARVLDKDLKNNVLDFLVLIFLICNTFIYDLIRIDLC